MGVFEGAFTPTSNVATLEASKPSRRGFNMGIQQSGFALLGLGFGPIVATQLLVVLPSWHWVFVVVALPGLVVAYLLWRVLREPPHIGRRSAAFADVPAQAAEPRRWREIFSYRNVVLGTLVLFGAFSCIFVISALVPSYLTDYIRLSLTQMGFVTSAIGGFVAQNYGIQNTLYVALFGLFVGFAITFLLKETAPSKTGQRKASEQPVVAPPVVP